VSVAGVMKRTWPFENGRGGERPRQGLSNKFENIHQTCFKTSIVLKEMGRLYAGPDASDEDCLTVATD
jgi:hypothetical protein